MNTTADLPEGTGRPRFYKRRNDNPRPPLAIRLRTLREQRNLSQVDVAVAIGVDRSTVAGWETGRDKPGRETLVAIAGFYDVALDWLASGEGPIKAGKAAAETEQEALLLFGFRQLPEEEAKAYLGLLLSRIKGGSS